MPLTPEEDFTVESLAAYLHLDPVKVGRLADRGKLPGRKVGGQWRFSQPEIHTWLENEIGGYDLDELEQVEVVLQRQAQNPSFEGPILAELLPLEAIAVPLQARTQTSVIAAMINLAAETGWLWDPDKMSDAVRAREQLHSTAIESGLALMHPRRPLPAILDRPFLALGRTNTGIPFGGSRGSLTDLFFLICSTDDRGHLQTLARLSRVISDLPLLGQIRDAATPEEIRTLLINREAELLT